MQYIRYTIFITLIGLGFSVFSVFSQEHELYKEVNQLYPVSSEKISNILSQAEKNEAVLKAIQTPWEAKPWYQYYPIFLTEKRLAKGLEFWKLHAQTLKKAQQTYGVPPQIVTAIIGVETFYGEYLGKYSVLDALYTLGYHYPPRASFFKKELAHLIALVEEEKLDITELKGSYAGAMGYGQFIPSSYRAYAVDFDGDGQRQLITNPTDAIGSVAHYFAEHKWQAGQPVAAPAWVENEQKIKPLLTKGLNLTHTVGELKQAGINFTTELADSTPAKLLQFEEANTHAYWVVFPNFYTITRYNHSPLYALAVFQFSEQLARSAQTLEP